MGVAIIIEDQDRDRVAGALAIAAEAIEAEARIIGRLGGAARERRLCAEAGRLRRLAEIAKKAVNV
jgi:hypothetical protein